VAYVADRADLVRTLEADVEGEGLDSATSALKVLVLEEHLLELGVGLTNVAELVVPLVDGGIRQPDSGVAGLILGRCTTNDGLVHEGHAVIPASVSGACQVLSLLLLAGSSGVSSDLGVT
jgi:hypothetical protein